MRKGKGCKKAICLSDTMSWHQEISCVGGKSLLCSEGSDGVSRN